MSEKRENPTALRVLATAGLAALAVVVACDVNAPVTVITALDEAVTALEAEGKLDSEEGVRIRVVGGAGGDGAPIIYVDGVRVDIRAGEVLDRLVPEEIDRVEVLKGPAAVESHGEEARGGVIQIITSGTATDDDMELIWAVPTGGGTTLPIRVNEVGLTWGGVADGGVSVSMSNKASENGGPSLPEPRG